MTGSDSLFRLIKSLDQNEKRYFKLFVSKYHYKQENNYLQLFEAIDRQKNYSESSLKKDHAHARFIKNLAAEKHYLFRLILKSLNAYHSEDSIDTRLKELIKNADVLFGKSLFKECKKILYKAKKLAYLYERYIYILEIITLERQLITHRIFTGRLEEKAREEKKIIALLTALYAYRDLSSRVRDIIRQSVVRDTSSIQKIKKLLKHPLYKTEPAIDSFSIRRYYYNDLLLCHRAINDLDKNYFFAKKQVELFEQHPALINEYINIYLGALSNFIIAQSETHRYRETMESLSKVKELRQKYSAAKNPLMEIDIMGTYYGYSLGIYLQFGEVEKGAALLPETCQWINKHEASVNKAQLIPIYMMISNTYFSAEDYKKALRWLQKIIHFPEEDFREDLLCFARIVNLIIHYKLRNEDVLPYLIKGMFKYLSKRKRLFGVEIAILKFFKNNRKAFSSKGKTIEAFKTLHRELVKTTEDPNEKKALDIFDIISWLESEISKKTFAEIIKAKGRRLLEERD